MDRTFATVVADAVPVVHNAEYDLLTIPVPNGWDDVKHFADKVLRYGDKLYAFTGWDSDKHEAYFAVAKSVALVIEKTGVHYK